MSSLIYFCNNHFIWKNIFLFVELFKFFFYQVIAITVEEECDIEKFKDFKVTVVPEVVAASSASEPPSPKEDSEPQIVSKEPSISKHVESHKREDRIFSSPLARKLAEDHNVSFLVSNFPSFVLHL